MPVQYILVHADFDENESEVIEIKDEDFLRFYFDSDEQYLEPLLKSGIYKGEWESYHLIKLQDYK